MKNSFYKIGLLLFAVILCAAVFAELYAAHECEKAGGRYMKELVGFYSCVLP